MHRPLALAVALATFAGSPAAQNTNQDAPRAWHRLEFQGGATLEVSYRQFTIAEGKTLRALQSGEIPDEWMTFYNDRYIPYMLDGRFAFGAQGKIGDIDLSPGKYRFAFRLDDDRDWTLVVYTDTGKETVGEDLMSLEKGWWAQEEELGTVTLATETSDEEQAVRLAVLPVAEPTSNGGAGALAVRFGPLSAAVPFRLAAAEKPATGAGGTKQ